MLEKRYLKLLKKNSITSYIQALYIFPKKIVFIDNNSLLLKNNFLVKGRIFSRIKTIYKKNIFINDFLLSTYDKKKIKIMFFNQFYLTKILNIGDEISVIVKKKKYGNNENYIATKIFYGKNSEKLYNEVFYDIKDRQFKKEFSTIIKNILSSISIKNFLPDYLHNKYKLIDRKTAFKFIHFPNNNKEYEKAKKYFLFEEIFIFYLKLYANKLDENLKLIKNITFKKNTLNIDVKEKLIEKLPFNLTISQEKCLNNVFDNLKIKFNNEILIQGDVGSGKTIIAVLIMMVYSKTGYQSVLLAPTTILAKQHYNYIKKYLEIFNIRIALLTSKTSKKIKLDILQEIKDNEIDIVVGTHSLLNEQIKYKNLGLLIIDEQQRFGVEQRNFIKNIYKDIDVIYMTATPIPRTLAISTFSDLKIFNIDSLPKGRKNILTKRININNWEEIKNYIHKTLNNKEQIYIICPLVSKGTKSNLKNIENMYEFLKKELDKKINISILHGKQHEDIKLDIINNFNNKNIDIIIGTTVIEVGIHVENATLMIIFNADYFGLSQLHQLRGRVGRGGKRSICLLLSEDNENERLNLLEKNNNGFFLAYKDLEIRGPGDFLGNKQSGIPKFKFADIIKDKVIMNNIKDDVVFLLGNSEGINNFPKIVDFLKSRNNKINN